MSSNNGLRLGQAQQAPMVAKLNEAEFRDRDLSCDLLGAGLWIAYAALALVWFRGVMRRRTAMLLATVRERIATFMVARPEGRGLKTVKGLRPRPPLLSEPAPVRI